MSEPGLIFDSFRYDSGAAWIRRFHASLLSQMFLLSTVVQAYWPLAWTAAASDKIICSLAHEQSHPLAFQWVCITLWRYSRYDYIMESVLKMSLYSQVSKSFSEMIWYIISENDFLSQMITIMTAYFHIKYLNKNIIFAQC